MTPRRKPAPMPSLFDPPELNPDQTALLARVNAALARMEARGHHLKPDYVTPEGRAYGYQNLKRKRDEIAAGVPHAAYPMRREQLEMIAHLGALITGSVQNSVTGRAQAHRPTKLTPAQLVDRFVGGMKSELLEGIA